MYLRKKDERLTKEEEALYSEAETRSLKKAAAAAALSSAPCLIKRFAVDQICLLPPPPPLSLLVGQEFSFGILRKSRVLIHTPIRITLNFV